MVICFLHLLLSLSVLLLSCSQHNDNSSTNIKSLKHDSVAVHTNKELEQKQHIDFLMQQIAIDKTTKQFKSSTQIQHLKQKYPFILVQDTDYGILTEPDLWFYNKYDNEIDNADQARLIMKDREEFYHATGDHAYWQCFPTENVEFHLTEYGVTSDIKSEENYKPEENEARLVLYVYNFVGESTSIQNDYTLPDLAKISTMKRLLAKWEKMLQHEDYFCLGGKRKVDLDDYHTSVFHEETNYHYTYYWDLYDLKTKHSCYGYADNCKSRLQKFQQDLKKGNI
jgi:hypothetical protein